MAEGVPGIFRIIAPVSDLDEAADFYRRCSGLKAGWSAGGAAISIAGR